MTVHRFNPESAAKLQETDRYRYLSRDELLGALSVDEADAVVDLGSGTGFYTREVAPYVECVYAIDLQRPMHDAFRTAGVPGNVSLLWAKAAALPFSGSSLAAAYSTMTYHEYETGAMDEVYRVLEPGGRLVIVDWSATGSGERGPPPGARATPDEVASELQDIGFSIDRLDPRPETFLIGARKP